VSGREDKRPRHSKPGVRTFVFVGLFGAAITVIAYVISGGSVLIFVAALVLIGILLRVGAYALVRNRGEQPPRRWWL
jgi:VIT1/CCC1 family predicted Fe2+/Mn2+ transporter